MFTFLLGDAISLVSEVLDAEVTALTNSSSPGSSSSGSGHPSARKRWRGDDDVTENLSSAEIPDNRTEETMLTEETSSSGIASKNTSSQNRTTASSSSGGQMQSSPPGTTRLFKGAL